MQKMKSQYREGPEAKEDFEQTMKTLFQAPKITPEQENT